MPRLVRTLTKRIFIIANCAGALVLLAACLNAFLSPVKWWWISLLGLGFPFLLLLNLLFIVFWLVFRSRWALLSFITLLLAIPNIRVLIGFSSTTPLALEKDSSTLRILSWNVSWFAQQNRSDHRSASYRKEMLDYIEKQQADILCFQEYLETDLRGHSFTHSDSFARMGYTYRHFAGDYFLRNGEYIAGNAIFSRYPIVNTWQWKYPGSRKERAAESLIAVDIQVKGRMIRVYTTHLQSILFRSEDYRNLEIIKNAEDSLLDASKSIVRKLRTGYRFRSEQAEMVKKELNASPFPEILCGDFNDVPNSYVYFTIRGKRKDAFLEKGAGLGRTYSRLSPTLRIDHMLLNPGFEVKAFQVDPIAFSDHFPLVADLAIPVPEK